MKTQAETDKIKLKAKIRYRDALVRFQMKHLDFRLLAAEALDGDNRGNAEAIQPEPEAQATAPQPPEVQGQEFDEEEGAGEPEQNTQF